MAWRGRRDDDDDDDIREEFAGGFSADDEDDDEDDDDDGESDLSDTDADLRDDSDSGSEPTVPCPACGAEMFEDSPRCPVCGEYVSAGGSQAGSRPLWVVVTAVICLAMAVWMALVGL
jgi:hypothetical protein